MRNKIIGGAFIALTASFVALHEGYSPIAYLDPVGIPTICYGETVDVTIGQSKTKQECDTLLYLRLVRLANQIDDEVKPPMTEKRHAALVSFVYNVGINAFRNSTLLKRLNANDIKACDELSKWVYAKGKKLPGLVKRRENERELCNS